MKIAAFLRITAGIYVLIQLSGSFVNQIALADEIAVSVDRIYNTVDIPSSFKLGECSVEISNNRSPATLEITFRNFDPVVFNLSRGWLPNWYQARIYSASHESLDRFWIGRSPINYTAIFYLKKNTPASDPLYLVREVLVRSRDTGASYSCRDNP